MIRKYLSYRGNIKAAMGNGGTLIFVTTHSEKQPTDIYRLSMEKLSLSTDALPCGGLCLALEGEDVWVGGTDGHLYHCSAKVGAPKALGKPFTSAPKALAPVSNDRLAVLTGSEVSIVSRANGKVQQSLPLEENGSALAIDPSGKWLVAGTAKGTISVFECEEQAEFNLSASERLHDGAVQALLFEKEELRFFSAGTDQKLLSTHARGNLEPEDRGRGANHSDQITAMLWGPGDRFFTGSRDKTVKSWPWPGNVRPATLKDGIIKVVDLAIVDVNKKPHLAVICDDSTIRVFSLDEAGKPGELVIRCHDAIATMKRELDQDDPARREAALRTLSDYNDTQSMELISDQVGKDNDHSLRLLAAQLLSETSHSKAPKHLEKWLKHKDEKVRVAAFEGLRRHLGEDSLKPMKLALATDQADIGRLAVKALEPLASADDRALARLTEVLDAKTQEVRQAALLSLEKVYLPDSPEANLIALQSTHADVRVAALVRLYQRKLLDLPQVQAIIRWRTEDNNAGVRQTAFLLTLHTREALVPRLRQLDPELNRQLEELERLIADRKKKKAPEEAATDVTKEIEVLAAQSKKAEKFRSELSEEDYEPLLQATASRSLDTCLRGARGLALLGDTRAFGLLLQLSRENDAMARVEVCKALAALDDPRSVKRLHSLLYDNDLQVRDAAFSALAQIYSEEPLKGAEAGLSASYEDVRRRGLQALIALIRKKKPSSAEEPTWKLLVRALNDNFPSVRTEAFKAALNQQIDGGGPKTLRFVLQSIHADIRLEVLTEVMAQLNEEWAWPLLLTFYNDPDPTLRSETFEFANTKAKDLEALEAALCSRYVDLRKLAVAALIKKHTGAAQSLLTGALADEDREVRQQALESLILDDARVALLEALRSEHADVRSRAGIALAKHGEEAAFGPLEELASAPEPEEQERKQEWVNLVCLALDGLAILGDARAHGLALRLTESKQERIRDKAATVLVWSTRPDTMADLRALLQHADNKVRYQAALGLALLGDPLVSAQVFSSESESILSGEQRLAAALCLGAAGEDQLTVLLDSQNASLRNQALILLMLLELKDPQPVPARCLAALSSLMPRARLTAARGLETFTDRKAFFSFVMQLINDRGDEKPWTIDEKAIDALAEVLVHGEPHLQARAALLLQFLTVNEQKQWNQAWSAYRRRFDKQIKELQKQAKARSQTKIEEKEAELKELAFGAYVGLVREQGESRGGGGHAVKWQQIVRVRQTALDRILGLANEQKAFRSPAKAVLIQALGDPNQIVRLRAFDHLQSLGMDNATLGAEALEAGHLDLGVKGLELLTDGTSAKEGASVLEQVMLSRKDDLAVEAAKLFMKHQGRTAGATRCLSAAYEPLRGHAVSWLEEEYDNDSKAQVQLREALKSRYQPVREKAALALATKKDPKAFEGLSELLTQTDNASKQSRLIQALVELGDERAPSAFLDRIENDPRGTASLSELFEAAGNFRRKEDAQRIFEMMDRNSKWRSAGFDAILTISGYDQYIQDPDDESEDKKWLEKQHPRHDDLLARLMEFCINQGATNRLRDLIRYARWAPGKEVEPYLVTLASSSDDDRRRQAIEALGWRLKKRNGSAEPLVQALSHKDPESQFSAAEGLALAGRADGINILLSSIEFLQDDHSRSQAIKALGELADERALDVLLKIVNDSEHPLREDAAEALGHMGKSSKRDEVLQLLLRLGRSTDIELSQHALIGLRYMDVAEGWQLIRERVADSAFWSRDEVIPELAHNDDPATRDLLLRFLRESDDWSVLNASWEAARKLFGEESLEPAYAIFENPEPYNLDDYYDDAMKDVSEKGDPARIFTILEKVNDDELRSEFSTSLITRKEPPLKEAEAALNSSSAVVVRLAARILGRFGKGSKSLEQNLMNSLEKWQKRWEELRQESLRTGSVDSRLNQEISPCLESLVWASGRMGAATGKLIELLTSHSGDALFRAVRLEALTALSLSELPREADKPLEKLATGDDPEMRSLAADLLGRHRQKQAEKMAEKMLSDRMSFNRMVSNEGVEVSPTLQQAAQQIHYQGVVLPHLVAREDIPGLTAIMQDKKLPEHTRLGAIEALARMAKEEAEAKLVELGKTEGEEDDLRKAAWRGLHRSRRARKKAAATG